MSLLFENPISKLVKFAWNGLVWLFTAVEGVDNNTTGEAFRNDFNNRINQGR